LISHARDDARLIGRELQDFAHAVRAESAIRKFMTRS
jgi:hypothetical protein